MMTLVLDGVAPEQTLVLLKLEDARDLHEALRALDFRENCVIDISKNGLRIIVDDQNCVQGIAYFKIDLFTEFILNQDVVTFRIPLPIFAECLSAFGAGVSTVLKMTYDGFGEPLKVLIEKDGIVARCLIKTQNPDVILDFDFNPIAVAAKIIMKPWMLRETFHELDQSSPSVGFRVDRFSLSVITEGDMGKIKTKFPHYSEQIERLECKQDVEFAYRLSLIKRMTPSLDICSKWINNNENTSSTGNRSPTPNPEECLWLHDLHTCIVDRGGRVKDPERDRVMNQFALKAQIQQQLRAMDEDGEQMIKTTKSLKIKDEASSDENSDGEKGDDEDDAPVGSLKPKKHLKPASRILKDKRQRVENADEVAAYESDDGDDEGREYDYMSDSGSESETRSQLYVVNAYSRDAIPMEQKVDEAMVAVGDETGLKKLIGDDFSDTDSSDVDDITKKLLAVEDDEGDELKKQFIDVDERDSSGSDSDDPDKEINSAIFLPVKKSLEEPSSSTARKRPLEDGSLADTDAKKIKIEQSHTAPLTSSTQPTTNQDGLNEETVRRYLRRKPHTTKELLSKIKSKCGDMEKSEIVQKLAAILKRIEPHQFKQKHGKKEVLFFSLNNNLA
ncbi:unnamed protein product [Litomosoides sigmodontis]|uniref:Transcription initiation factor IIF subunit alpha n=1 Tax=Litomosoides sigmodontis TaxID=42156 RepID=A0A3P6ULS2_LITSI|nr:unnamed protein product [Litomosoides sigmodontis]